jgi:hypothetical protein
MVPCLIAAAKILRHRHGARFEALDLLKERLLAGFSSPIPTFPQGAPQSLAFDLGSVAGIRSFSLHPASETFDELSAIRRPVLTSGECESVGVRHS